MLASAVLTMVPLYVVVLAGLVPATVPSRDRFKVSFLLSLRWYVLRSGANYCLHFTKGDLSLLFLRSVQQRTQSACRIPERLHRGRVHRARICAS